ncbi:MAG: hypothetical protein DRP87_03515 [Spirochaetes bacterium]|nr:MAG: hypothetical protein DRP87_03515 [Spirochaetota bacterium]
MSDKQVPEELDPEVAELIGLDSKKNDTPDFSDLFDEKGGVETAVETEQRREKFLEITKFEEKPKDFFKDKDYYKKVLSGEGESSHRVHEALTKFLKSQDPQDRTLYRGKLQSAYWNLAAGIASKIHTNLPLQKILLLRYGVLLPTLISKEQREIISKIIFDNNTGEPVYYTDEWLKAVASGKVSSSAMDETKQSSKNENQKIFTKLEKAKGQVEAQLALLKNKLIEMDSHEISLKEKINFLTKREIRAGHEGLKDVYNVSQKSVIGEATEILKQLNRLDREATSLYEELEEAQENYKTLSEEAKQLGADTEVDNAQIIKEFNTVRQMIKICVGRQGNHFPIAMQQYLRANINDIATRENVIHHMAAVEHLDPGIFLRTFRRQTNRIIPHVILVPCYGDRGICWEPFERFNRATSKGRIAIPMYPKDVRTAVIYALGDLRWQVAKEYAQHYWMEEGLTGKYYQWFSDRKMKGDVREAFIQDYYLWITKESEGTQKLDREVRGIFWRNMPFPQEIKDKLKNRGFVYSELYKKDLNISMSDGY